MYNPVVWSIETDDGIVELEFSASMFTGPPLEHGGVLLTIRRPARRPTISDRTLADSLRLRAPGVAELLWNYAFGPCVKDSVQLLFSAEELAGKPLPTTVEVLWGKDERRSLGNLSCSPLGTEQAEAPPRPLQGYGKFSSVPTPQTEQAEVSLGQTAVAPAAVVVLASSFKWLSMIAGIVLGAFGVGLSLTSLLRHDFATAGVGAGVAVVAAALIVVARALTRRFRRMAEVVAVHASRTNREIP